MSKTVIYLIRHAQSFINIRLIPTADTSTNVLGSDLTEEGIKQVDELINKLGKIKFSTIYTSPLLRTLRTARIFAKAKNLDIQVIKDLRERKKGKLGGLSVIEAKEKYQYIYGDSNRLSDKQMLDFKLFPDMESAREAAQRLTKTLVNLAEKNVGKTIAVISHGNIIRSFLIANNFATFKQLPTGSFGNTGFVRIEVDKKRFIIKETYLVNIISI